MNILPKKSWHVRTKKNIERVRKDEAEAAAKEKELQKRAKVAELEASLDVLRKRNADKCDTARSPDVIDVSIVNPSGSSGAGHLNLFRDIEIHEGKFHGTNAEAELDKKREVEDWEKKVGILQYLGQSTSEEQRFYQKNEKTVEASAELSAKQQRMKDALDPMASFPKYAKSQLHMVPKKRKVEEYAAEKKNDFVSPVAAGSSREKSRRKGRSASYSSSSGDTSDLCRKRSRKRRKHSKHKSQTKRRKSPSSESDPESEEERKQRKRANLEILRKQRLDREERERKRTQEFLDSLAARSSHKEEERVETDRNRRYNSQYNPHLARY
ncbi:leukocyte receptor cluster member 1 [Galendromus occidentalis]|uniref:Leukocyte receptor cluster member 1 n=1 Tax=Galendromus occidentalis TaxID=34638 RepID=A0AAJ6QQ40_9ACAR|nr:leukocyte receptor cluster member 1 [Galendromus occidentalis]